MNDEELLVAFSGQRAPGSVYAVALAVRVLGPDATPPQIVHMTGFSRSQVYEATALLDARYPDWRADETAQLVALADADALMPVESGPPLWRVALNDEIDRVNPNGNARSWDAYADFYAPAADRCIAEGAGPGELIALTVDYFETVTGDQCAKRQRGQIAKLVHSHGKTALWGVSQALMCGDVDLDDQSALIRYANAVCRNTVAELRDRTNGGTGR